MACTMAASLRSTTVPAGTPVTGNLVITNGDSVNAVTVKSLAMWATSAPGQADISCDLPASTTVATAGTGTTGPVIAASGTLSVPFQMMATGATVTAQAVCSDGSAPTATINLTLL